jgi:proteasome lid subunit RPN8/RPN11
VRRLYRISVSELRKLRRQAEPKQKSGQREVCGLIVSGDGVHIRLVYLPNYSSRPGHFLITAKSCASLKDRATTQNEKVVGTFHSHPISEAIPGVGDIKNAKSGFLMLIYDVCGRQARLWEIRGSKRNRHARELILNAYQETGMERRSARG